MKIIRCDKCGKEEPPSDQSEIVNISLVAEIRGSSFVPPYKNISKDFCPSCYDKVRKVMEEKYDTIQGEP